MKSRLSTGHYTNEDMPEKQSATDICSKISDLDATIATSDQIYDDGPLYEAELAIKGSFMTESELGVTASSKELCKKLLDQKQATPVDTLFQDDRFRETYQKLQDTNKWRIIQDISRLIVPSAESLAKNGAKNLQHLAEAVCETWDSSFGFYGPLPHSDYAVGFAQSAFTNAQLKKLESFVGDIAGTSSSYFLATFYMYFPFLTCEVKCSKDMLDTADRENTHSMTVAVRAIVELFKLVGREEEVNREILAFSISHNHRTVRIYGHYAVIKGRRASFYRHPIRAFDFTELDGKDKWTAYKFTRNIYDIWMPDHLKRICSAVDDITDFAISLSDKEFSVARD